MNYKNVGFLHQQFIQTAKEKPSKLAVVDENQGSLTYKKLDNLSNKLAIFLQSEGIKENSIVIIYMDKCVQYVVAYIAILKAGASYLPLDISYPDLLIKDIVVESEPSFVISKIGFKKNLEIYLNNENIICLDDHIYQLEIEQLYLKKPSELVTNVSLESLAFVVYSSGTTGKPKGILVPLRAPIISYLWRHETFPYVGDNEREASNIFFVWELMRPLLKGQTLYIIPDDTIYDPKKLLEYLEKNEITRMLFTPSLLETVLDCSISNIKKGFKTMRQIWLCGEVTTTTLIERALRILAHVQFVNLYSISECHDVAAIDLTKFYMENPSKLITSKFTPVGSLLPLVKVALYDNDMKLQPVGVSGEIYVYGPTLAHGYLKRPDLNEKKFIPLPNVLAKESNDNNLMYRTGDWGYLLSDGSLEISGRCDAMVKIRGYSVEMAAIENKLMDIKLVQSCVVVTHGEEGSDKYLVAYIVPSEITTVKAIRGELKRRLPFYMIPSYFIFIKEIPILAVSGKLNKKALPAIEEFNLENKAEYLPETETEKILSNIWSKVLQISSIDIQESFFDLGGHSLLATKLLQIINDKIHIQLSVKDLYLNPTIFQMGKLIDKQTMGKEIKEDLQKVVEMHCQYDTDFDIQLRAFWRFSNFNKTRWSSARVLLTGSTGYLGAFILMELLKSTESHIFCLIRENIVNSEPKNVEKIQKRLLNTLGNYHLLGNKENSDRNDFTENMINERVTLVKGDVSIINFGLTENDYLYLSTEIDYIIHAAAYVNLIYPYSALYSSNVLGTCNVIKFASFSKIKPLHYISTDAIFPDNLIGREDSNIGDCWKDLKSGYSQTKWVAEQLVLKISQRGHPVIIYRLGNQGVDSVNASLNIDDFNFMMIRSFAYLGCVPNMDWKIEMTPVNFSAKVIITFAKSLPDYIGKVFHLINSQTLQLKTLRSWLTTRGYQCDAISYDEYLERLKTSKIEFLTKLHSLLAEVGKSEEYFKNLPQHDSSWTKNYLFSKGIIYPSINIELFNVFCSSSINRHLIPKPRKDVKRYRLFDENNLSGKIAIVTGASSGIGEETAIQLSACGCIVALIARREDKLEKIKDFIVSNGGQAIYIKADISKESEVINAMKIIESRLGPVDILINCAGTMFYQHSYDLRMVDCDTMIDINVKGLLYCTTEILKGMVERKRGHIVNISSDAGKVGFPGLAVYSGTKFFVEGYSQALRQEVSKYNIRVTCVLPGDVRTPLLKLSAIDKSATDKYANLGDDSSILETKDVAKTIVFIVSAPSYVAINELLIEPVSRPT